MPGSLSNRRKTAKPARSAPRTAPAEKPFALVSEPVEAADDRPMDLTKVAYEQLRSDILRGRLRPDDKLGAEALRHRFNFGSTPIREALNRLLAEGLVALEPQKGFRVAPATEQELGELVTARCWIDGAAITEAIRRRDQDWEESLLITLHRLSRTVRRSQGETSDNHEWEERHRAFHKALVSGCGTRWIIRISEQLFDAAERYRLLAADQFPQENELAEHRAIVDACIAGDARRAIEQLTKHYGCAYRAVADSLRSEA